MPVADCGTVPVACSAVPVACSRLRDSGGSWLWAVHAGGRGTVPAASRGAVTAAGCGSVAAAGCGVGQCL